MNSPGHKARASWAGGSWIGAPLDLGSDLQAEIANTRHVAEILKDAGNIRRATAAAEFVHGLVDRTLTAKVTEPVACAKGCDHCCHTYVSATIPEVLRLAELVRGRDDAVAVIAAIQDAAARARVIDQDKRFLNRVSCPLLDGGACSGYSARPLACRTMLSASLEACLRYFPLNGSGSLVYAPGSREVRGRVELVLLAALNLAGLSGQHVELIQGLSVALTHDDAEGRWLAGEPIFSAVAADAAEGKNDALNTWVPVLVQAARAGD